MEKTLVLIKPDAVERNLIGKIITFYEEEGLKVVNLKLVQITKDFAEKHYSVHKGKIFYDELIQYITRSPLCAMVLQGEDVIEKVRKVNGATNPDEAQFGTIRRCYGIDKTQNCVHASDSIKNAKEEIKLWFGSN